MTDEEKNIKAIIESGEVEMYSREWFRLKGKLGYLQKLKKHGKDGIAELQRKAQRKSVSARRKLSTKKLGN